MEGLINIFGAATAFVCAALLYRGYWRTGVRLLAWSGLCFLALSIENSILFVDRYVVPHIQLAIVRQSIAAAGIACLIFSLIWETD